MAKKIKQTVFFFIIATLITVISQSAFSSNQWTAEECRSCHDNYQGLSLNASNSDLHHYLTGKKTRLFGAKVPNEETDGSDLYYCMTCHPIGNTSGGYVEILTERNCLKCHSQGTEISYRHHYKTGASTNYNCSSCHSRLTRSLY